MIQSVRIGYLHERADLAAAAGLPEKRHIVRVAAESFDIAPDPAEYFHDILHA